MKNYSIGKLNLSAPEKSVKVSEVGVDAYEIVLTDEKTKEKDAWITVALVSIGFTQSVAESLRFPTLKSTYLELTKAGDEKVNRTIMGQKVTGEKQKSLIPKPIVVESYLV